MVKHECRECQESKPVYYDGAPIVQVPNTYFAKYYQERQEYVFSAEDTGDDYSIEIAEAVHYRGVKNGGAWICGTCVANLLWEM